MVMSKRTQSAIEFVARAALALGPVIEGHLSTRMLAGLAAILGGIGMWVGVIPAPEGSLGEVLATAAILWGYVQNRQRRDEVGG